MKTWVYGLYLSLIFLSVSCGEYRKIEKSQDWRIKYEAALRYYEEGEYYRAGTLLESILPLTTGLPEGEKIQFYYAQSQFQQKLYLLSSHHFKTFYETYARSELAQEAQFMYAYSLYAASPNYNLDQSSSLEAVNAMQTFLNRYPNNEFKNEASRIIDELQVKLERKARENAIQYYKLGFYKAGLVAFDNFRKEFPDSRYNEEISYLKIKAQYSLAQQSIYTKQKDRYEEVVDLYQQFIDKYPSSSFLKDAEKDYVNSLAKLSEFQEKTVNR